MSEAADSSARPYKPNSTPVIVLVVVAVVAVIGFLIYHTTHKGPPDHSASIALNIGATSCSASGYEISSRLDGSKTLIYDCMMSDGNYKCVTRENGIDKDQTDTVKLLFASTLGSGKPACIGG